MPEVDPFIQMVFGPPPPGIDLNAQTETRNDIITGVFLAVAVLSVLARWISRNISRAGFQADDHIIFIALALCIATAIVNILIGPAGSGHHVWSLTRATVARGFKIAFVYTFIWAVTVSTTKLSIIFLYRRIFAVRKSPLRNWLNFLAGVMVCQIIAITVSNLTICRPLSYLWERLTQPDAHGTCFDQPKFLLATGIINAIFDIIILITPIVPISKLQLSADKKAGVFGILLLGCLVCIASWVRVYYLVVAATVVDRTWLSGETATWSSIEASLGIVSACLPVLRPLYRKIRNKPDVPSKITESDFSGSKGEPHSHNRFSHKNNSDRDSFGQHQSDEAINLTSFACGGPLEVSLGADRVMVRSEIRQARSYV
ncbi:hypothetical protein F5Y09DRAFT_348970 [Xylaria sp. FL1042]|nr:hypothetical protein F5Y09DRAFT_348970 [Xylaria sp. FL1042]